MRLMGVDGLRSIACLLVLLHHAVQRLQIPEQSGLEYMVYKILLTTAPSGVSVFFVLSGLLLSHPFWQHYLAGKPLPSLKEYSWRRLARIVPAFYLALFAAMALEQIIMPAIPADAIRLLASMSFLSGFYYMTLFATPVNGPLWTISFEMTSYVLMPLGMIGLFRLMHRRTFGAALGYWLGLLALVFIGNQLVLTYCQPDDFERGWKYGGLGGAKYMMPNYNPLGMFAHYVLGILAAGFITWLNGQDVLRRRWQRQYRFDILASLGLLAFFGILVTQTDTPDFGFSLQHQPYFFPALAGSVAFSLICLPYSRWLGPLLDNPFCRYTARISFGLYLWHFFVMTVFGVLANYWHNTLTNVSEWGYLTLGVIVVTYLIASLSWYGLERPILRKVHNAPRQQPSQTA